MFIDYKRLDFKRDGVIYRMYFYDPSGFERFGSIINQHAPKVNYICLVYAVNDAESFHVLIAWIREIEKNTKEIQKMVLIVNKCDFNNQRVISKEEAKTFAQQFKMPFLEVSAKDNSNIQECHDYIIDDLINSNLDKIYRPIPAKSDTQKR